jgi:hypothetical protein
MRFLGELYSYKHIDSSVLFETLYLIIVFGHGTGSKEIPPSAKIWDTLPSSNSFSRH